MKTNICIYDLSRSVLLEWELFQTSCRENQKTHFMFNNLYLFLFLFFFENRALDEIVW